MTKEGLARLKLDEGLRLKAYPDTVGVFTIGYGHTGGLKEGDTCTLEDADRFLFRDVAEAENDAMRIIPNFYDLSPVRRDAITNMAFNLGGPRLAGFRTFLRCLAAGEWKAAAGALIASKWHHQVKSRALRIERAIREG